MADSRGYALGIDVGTTYTAAAVADGDSVEMLAFGHRSTSMPSVVYLDDDDAFLTGDAANRRAIAESSRVAREFKRRVGDSTPVMLGGRPYSIELLTSELLRAVAKEVTTERAAAPAAIVLTHPANWGAYKKDVLLEAARLGDIGAVSTISEPEAAATWYANQARVVDGSTIAVFDLGGGTFDATVLRRVGEGFELLGSPRGIDRLGGIDFDEVIFRFVLENAALNPDTLDADDPAIVAALAQLRRDCVEAKEALSSDTTAMVNVFLPGRNYSVRITRADFEHLIGPLVDRTVTALSQALTEAGLTPAAVDAVLLVGGASRTPIVGRRVTEALGVPVTLDAHPKHSVALGAALVGARSLAPGSAVPPPAGPPAPEPPEPAVASSPAPPVIPSPVGTPTTPAGNGSRTKLVVAIVGLLAVALIAAAVALTRGGGDTQTVTRATSDASSTSVASVAPFVGSGGTTCNPGSATGFPSGVVVDGNGDILVADGANHRVTKVTPGGTVVEVFAGTGEGGSAGDGGQAVDAQLDDPRGMVMDPSGAVLIADFGADVVRRVDPSGAISTVMGSRTGGSRDEGTKALEFALSGPSGIALDESGTLFVSVHVANKVVKVDGDGTVHTVLGTPEGGAPVGRAVKDPGALAFDRNGALLVATGHEVVALGTDGGVKTFAGTGTAGFAGDGDAATSAQLCGPEGIAANDGGDVFIADRGNDRIRLITSDGKIFTFAGTTDDTASTSSSGDSIEPSQLRLPGPLGVFAAPDGTVVMVDGADVYKYADGVVTLLGPYRAGG